MSKLTSEAVLKLLGECNASSGAIGRVTTVDGIVRKYDFDLDRVHERADEIGELLGELPSEFQRTGGGGWSFLNACQDRHGKQWTDLHMPMETLFCLGIAAGNARWLVARDMWDVLPGGMPYVQVN